MASSKAALATRIEVMATMLSEVESEVEAIGQLQLQRGKDERRKDDC
jgi:hypothetical protein